VKDILLKNRNQLKENKRLMSASTKQKHVFLEALNSLPLPTENQSIVKVLKKNVYFEIILLEFFIYRLRAQEVTTYMK
jgi:hypothetical protein